MQRKTHRGPRERPANTRATARDTSRRGVEELIVPPPVEEITTQEGGPSPVGKLEGAHTDAKGVVVTMNVPRASSRKTPLATTVASSATCRTCVEKTPKRPRSLFPWPPHILWLAHPHNASPHPSLTTWRHPSLATGWHPSLAT